MTKTCTKCKETKPETVFHLDRGRRMGVCGECRNAARRARGEKGGRRETPDERRARLLWKWYKITPAQYAALLEAQNGVCAICRKPSRNGRQLSVDHCHATEVVRALLCHTCNFAVGFFEIHGQAAAEYLARYGAGNPLLKP